MGWTLFWAAGLLLILWNQIRTAGLVVGVVKTFFLGIGWSLAVGVLIVVASIFGAFGDQLDQSVNSSPIHSAVIVDLSGYQSRN